jgi:hypothetical protein
MLMRRIASQLSTACACSGSVTRVEKLNLAALQVVAGANDLKAAVRHTLLEQRRLFENQVRALPEGWGSEMRNFLVVDSNGYQGEGIVNQPVASKVFDLIEFQPRQTWEPLL